VGTFDTALSALAPLSLDKMFQLLFFVIAFEQGNCNIYYIKKQVFFKKKGRTACEVNLVNAE
jgi:hypothetical protein